MKRLIVMLAGSLVLLGSTTTPHVSAQQGDTPTPDASSDDGGYTPADVAHSVSFDRIRADLFASHTLWIAGDYKSAAAHAADANTEFKTISSDLAAQNVDTQLKKLLDAYVALVGQAGDTKNTDDAFLAAMDYLDYIQQVLIGPLMTDVKFQGILCVEVLQLIEKDYRQAVKDGKIVDPASYQVAAALLVLNRSRWDGITTGVEELDNAATIQAQFDMLGKDLPDIVHLPPKLATPDDLSKTIDNLTDAIRSSLQLPQSAATQAASPQ